MAEKKKLALVNGKLIMVNEEMPVNSLPLPPPPPTITAQPETPVRKQKKQRNETDIKFINGLGWAVAAVLGAILVTLVLNGWLWR